MGDNFVHLDVALGAAERDSVSLAFNPGKFFSVRNEQGQIQSALGPGFPLVATPFVAGASFFQGLLFGGQREPLDSLFQAVFSDDIHELHLHPDFEPEGFRDEKQIAKYRALQNNERFRILNADMRVRAFVLVTPIASAGTVALFFLCCLALGLSLRVCIWSTAALAVALELAALFRLVGFAGGQSAHAIQGSIHDRGHTGFAAEPRRRAAFLFSFCCSCGVGNHAYERNQACISVVRVTSNAGRGPFLQHLAGMVFTCGTRVQVSAAGGSFDWPRGSLWTFPCGPKALACSEGPDPTWRFHSNTGCSSVSI